MNSVAIAVLNVSYIFLAMFILKKENNKFIEVNTQSLISKLFIFKFSNSFSNVFVNIYILLK